MDRTDDTRTAEPQGRGSTPRYVDDQVRCKPVAYIAGDQAVQANKLILTSPTLEDLISPFEDAFPNRADFDGYQNHCLRMLNVVLALSEEEPDRREKLEIALAFHDITVFPSRTLDYLDSSSDLARRHLQGIGREDWSEEITLMICMHHKITPYRGKYQNLVEAFRRADWIDVSFGLLKFGLPPEWVRDLHQRLPLYTFYPRTMFPLIGRYMLRHPFNPLPNFRL